MIETPCQHAAVELRALSKQYACGRVLDEVSLRIEPGTILGLVGRNGAGKSTLIECLLGLRPANHGEALLFGKPAGRLDDTDKAGLGYVPQQPVSFDWMKVGELFDFMAGLYPDWDAAHVARLVDRFALDSARRLSTLSPGERQQVAIIRALGPQPRLLVLDEPAAALDPLARRELLREIVDMAGERGTTVLFSTHIISDLERVASHIAVLHQGRLRLHGELDLLKDELRRVAWPDRTPPAQPLPGELSRRPLAEGGWSLVVRDPARSLAATLPASARLHGLSLEDLFVELAA